MSRIIFFDLEVAPKTGKILDIGATNEKGATLHSGSVPEFIEFIKGTRFLCGHNIIHHDLKYLKTTGAEPVLPGIKAIDTLYLSPLLFPLQPYHALVKDDKLQSEDLNNPLSDSIRAKELFYEELSTFLSLPQKLKHIYYFLLSDQLEFRYFFEFSGFQPPYESVELLIRKVLNNKICHNSKLNKWISESPISLSYCISLLYKTDKDSITPPWVLHMYPQVEPMMYALRNKPCLTGCDYCNQVFDARLALNKYFGFTSFRTYGGEPLQQKAIEAAIDGQSLVAIFPTGGGKSITFQLPALISGENAKALTVIISPLQSLMKDQVYNLEQQGITRAVTINGLLDPIERAESIERVANGSAHLLYISPESLRSKTIERLLLGRKITRFVIDEAHCFSAWGQDFRVDYLYIGDFIGELQRKKNLDGHIPISCFTATAKLKVVEDIKAYFNSRLSLNLQVFKSTASRTNLHYKLLEKGTKEEKYITARNLIEAKNCPTIIYVSRTKRAENLADQLQKDGFNAMAYHGKMEAKQKSTNQNAFITGATQIMVATSAFGMGVDKKDVQLVIHFDISDSLENYVQEAGRAGRDEALKADCYVLYNDDDLSKHFIMLNQTKLSIAEIRQIWKAIKDITRFRSTASNSALEIARKAGWDDGIYEIETRVKTAISALEEAGYLKRGQNMPRVFANSIRTKNAQEAIDRIEQSSRFSKKQKEHAIRIIKKLFASKSRKHHNSEQAESRIDHISDHLGIVKQQVMDAINLMRDENILADARDLTAYVNQSNSHKRSQNILSVYGKLERFLCPLLSEEEQTYDIKELNELAETQNLDGITPKRIKTIANIWEIKNWIRKKQVSATQSKLRLLSLYSIPVLKDKIESRHKIARFIVDYLFTKSITQKTPDEQDEILVEFSVLELKQEFQKELGLFQAEISLGEVEDALFYLSRIEAIKIEGGFMVVYNKLTIDRLEKNNKVQYKNEDYQSLKEFYDSKVQQIHIVGEYAKKMVDDYKGALQFVEDYFRLNYSSFLNRYFKGSRKEEITKNITPAKFRQLFGTLSPAQLEIIKDNRSNRIVVAAGPGSGKTRVLVHKLASLLLLEDIKQEQLLMLTFSRAATTEFKQRLHDLIGNASHRVAVKTFHSFCFDLLGQVGSIEKSKSILTLALEKIKDQQVEVSMLTRSVLVIDEAQDMSSDEHELIQEVIKHNPLLRIIAVGDDDQNIFTFRKADSSHFISLVNDVGGAKYELTDNYRSAKNLVDFTNQFVADISNRFKITPISAINRNNGSLKITRYQVAQMSIPLVEEISQTGLSGTTCILTHTNEEASECTGLLIENGFKAKLIQSNEEFRLINMVELRYFLNALDTHTEASAVSENDWTAAISGMKQRFSKSAQLKLCLAIIKSFEVNHRGAHYKSDIKNFILESKMEDFVHGSSDTVFVSTIHKAKGKEFDSVFLLLKNFGGKDDDQKRQVYVAMTRAKSRLSIHLNSSLLDHIKVDDLEFYEDHKLYKAPALISIQLLYKDVWLDYFKNRQHEISKLQSGDDLPFDEGGCMDGSGRYVVKFSQEFQKRIVALEEKNYLLQKCKVNHILLWSKKDETEEILIVLPELQFRKIY